MPAKSPNLNILWAELLIEELVRHGIEHFCIAPGSRSAPLAIAAAQHPAAKITVHHDERGLGFFAMGYTAATRKPSVLITTSGTAVANLFPAVIEASKKKLPLIILTADRPPELRATGANQTIDQVKIFGDYVRFYFDLPCPTQQIDPQMVLTTVDQAVFRSSGELPGPVHLNCMFREPLSSQESGENFADYLAPLQTWEHGALPLTQYERGTVKVDKNVTILQTLKEIKHGIIIAGKNAGTEDQEAIIALSERLKWPIFADITSGLRLGGTHRNVIVSFDQILLQALSEDLQIDGILHLGGRMTSQRYYQWIKEKNPKHYLMVLKHPLRNDPTHNVTIRVQQGVAAFCQSLLSDLPKRSSNSLLKYFQKADHRCQKSIKEALENDKTKLSEPAVSRIISREIPQNSLLFIGNSMPIRDFDMYADSKGKSVTVIANRGASGIDGNIASAAGAAHGSGKACTVVLGDLAGLHDLNSLFLIKKHAKSFVVVIINNDGGGIFSFLPVVHQNHFEKIFGTPHGLNFSSAAKMYGLHYVHAKSTPEFLHAYRSALKKDQPSLLEITINRTENLKVHKLLQAQIKACLAH